MQITKKVLITSVLSMILCCAMLIGTTWAWFTDEVTSGENKITAGNLSVELYHESASVAKTKVTDATTVLFGDVALWEPGAYAYETFTVKNVGSLALKYEMTIKVAGFTSHNDHNLTEVLKVAVTDSTPATRTDVVGLDYTALADWSCLDSATDTSLEPDEAKTFTVVVYWAPTDHDNDYNIDGGLSVDLGVRLTATQLILESDSFGDDYDSDASNPDPPPSP